MIDDLREFASRLPAPEVQRVHVGEAILAWFRHLPKASVSCGDSPPPSRIGVPIVYDKALHPGAWQGKDRDGEVVISGQIGDPGKPVWYIPGQGFIQLDIAAPISDQWWL